MRGELLFLKAENLLIRSRHIALFREDTCIDKGLLALCGSHLRQAPGSALPKFLNALLTPALAHALKLAGNSLKCKMDPERRFEYGI